MHFYSGPPKQFLSGVDSQSGVVVLHYLHPDGQGLSLPDGVEPGKTARDGDR
jgi:hypothetical protein